MVGGKKWQDKPSPSRKQLLDGFILITFLEHERASWLYSLVIVHLPRSGGCKDAAAGVRSGV